MRKKSHKMSHHFRPALNNLDCEEDIWYFTAGEKALSIKSSYLSLHSCCTETATTLIGPGKVSRKILHHPPPITRGKKKNRATCSRIIGYFLFLRKQRAGASGQDLWPKNAVVTQDNFANADRVKSKCPR